MEVQKEGFKRLGVIGDWENRYATMDYSSEAAIVAEFHKFVASGQLYRGSKPVMWSPVERTALADAEVEYHDHSQPHDLGEVPGGGGLDAARGASVVIWTTTPWTIPANRAISYNEAIAYSVYQVEAMEDRAGVRALGQARRQADRGRQALGRGLRGRQDRQGPPRRGGRLLGHGLRAPACATSTRTTPSRCRCWPATT
jgi:isoleucyl-tRNA synthetase